MWRAQSDDAIWQHSHSANQSDLSDFLIHVLLLEDRNYFRHSGVEPVRSVLRTIKRIALGQRVGGVSTIDQQVVRIVRGRYERTISRKTSEMVLAYVLNRHFSKALILHYYIHNAYFGYRLEGCEIASQRIFGAPASTLKGPEAAYLAAALARPFPKAVVEGMRHIPVRERTAERLLSEAESAHPLYAVKLKSRAHFAQALRRGKLNSLLNR